jgi:hypothetical protein
VSPHTTVLQSDHFAEKSAIAAGILLSSLKILQMRAGKRNIAAMSLLSEMAKVLKVL